jgi:POT family proton-dependent oligopeptide transporter
VAFSRGLRSCGFQPQHSETGCFRYSNLASNRSHVLHTETTRPVRPLDKMPPGIPFIVGNEAAERFSFYGMKAILALYLANVLAYSESEAISHVHSFNTAVYFLPLLGAYISDRYWGKYRTIITLSVVYCLGHLVLSVWENRPGAFWGLALIALGAGGIKPCVSAHVGDQFVKGQEDLLQKVFNLFYFMINFGSFFSTLLIPWTRIHYGYQVAFAIPGILMGIATLVFWLGRHRYVTIPPSGPDPNSFGHVVWYAATHRSQRPAGGRFLDAARGRFTDEVVDGVQSAFNVMSVFFLVAIFWALFDQHSSSWIFQARKLDLEVLPPGTWLYPDGLTIAPEQVQAANPILVMLLIPLMTFVVYPLLERVGIAMTPLRRMSGGMLITGFSFVLVGLIQLPVDRGHSPSVLWQFLPYIVLTVAEVMVSITGLEFAYTQAPRSMKSTLMSFWMLTIAMGNALVAVSTHFLGAIKPWLAAAGLVKDTAAEGSEGEITAAYFFLFAGLMFVAAIGFALRARSYKLANYMES